MSTKNLAALSLVLGAFVGCGVGKEATDHCGPHDGPYTLAISHVSGPAIVPDRTGVNATVIAPEGCYTLVEERGAGDDGNLNVDTYCEWADDSSGTCSWSFWKTGATDVSVYELNYQPAGKQ